VVVDVRDQGNGRWRRSALCSDGYCVEVNADDDGVLVRNSADPGVQLPLATDAWKAFVDDLKADAFVPGEPRASAGGLVAE
jgi:hypothetical protein